MKRTIRLSLGIVLLFSATGSHAQWIPVSGMDGAPCEKMFLIDSTLITYTYPAIYTRQIDSLNWVKSLDDVYMEEFTIAGNCIIGISYPVLYRSFDKGATWDTMELTIWPANLVSVDTFVFGRNMNYDMFLLRSSDYGEHWDTIPKPSVTIEDFYLYSNDSTLFCIEDANYPIYYSEDIGNTWDSLSRAGLPSAGFYVKDIYKYGSTFWIIGNPNGIYRYSTTYDSWSCMNDTLPINKFSSHNGVLFGTGSGIYQLNSNWNNWIPRCDGVSGQDITGLASIDTLFFCASDKSPSKSDGSFNWEPFASGIHGGSINCISAIDNEVWVASEKYVYRSFDYGTSFEPVEFIISKDIYPKIIVTDSLYYLKDLTSFYISYDHGNSWTKEVTGLPAGQFVNLRDFSVGDKYLYITLYEGQVYRSLTSPVYWEPTPISFEYSIPVEAHNSTLLMGSRSGSPLQYPVKISHDYGISYDTLFIISYGFDWEPIFENDRFYLFEDDMIFFSVDDGYTWDSIHMNFNDVALLDISRNEEALFTSGSHHLSNECGNDPCVYLSYDEGSTWTDLNDNLDDCGSSTFCIVEILNNRVFLGTSSNGLWYRDDILTGIRDNPQKPGLSIRAFPNPSCSSVSVKCPGMTGFHSGRVEIRDLTGQLVSSSENVTLVNGFSGSPVDISALSPGIYILSFIQGGSPPLNCKFIRH